MKSILLSMISAVLLLVSCGKDDEDAPVEIGPKNLTEISMNVNGKLWQSIGPDEKILDATYIVVNNEKPGNKHTAIIIANNTNSFGAKYKKFVFNIDLNVPLVKGSYSQQSNLIGHSFYFSDGYDDSYVNESWYPRSVSSTLPFSLNITEISKIEDKGDLSIYRIRGTFNLKMVNINNDNEIITITNGTFK